MRWCDRGRQHANPSDLKGLIEMALRYRIPLPGPFYYSGRVGPKRRVSHSSCTGCGLMGFIVKWFIVYPGVVFFGAGLAIMVASFYGVFWVVCRWLRNRRRCRLVAPRFPVQCPLPQRSASGHGARSYGFVPDRRPDRLVSYGFVPASVCVPSSGARRG